MSALTTTKAARLAELETIIEGGLAHFVEVGYALAEIRDSKLYEPHSTFQEYCEQRWDISRQHARRLINAAEVFDNITIPDNSGMEPTGYIRDNGDSTIPEPRHESQLRPLIGLEPEKQREVWTEATEAAGGKAPTAAQVNAAVNGQKPKLLCRSCRLGTPKKSCKDCKALNAKPKTPKPESNGQVDREPGVEDESDKSLPTVDDEFTPIPARAVAAFAAAADIKSLGKEISAIIKKIHDAKGEPGWEMVLIDSVTQTLKNALMTLLHAKATHVCPYCEGKESKAGKTPCNCCKGRGWTTRDYWKNCPAILEREAKAK